MTDVPNPSDSIGSQELKNPFTDIIVYPRFPTSELSYLKEDDAEKLARGGNRSHGKSHKVLNGRIGDRGGKPVVNSDASTPRGNNNKNPIVISDTAEEGSMDKRDKRDRRHRVNELGGEKGDRSNGIKVSRTGEHSVGSEESSDDSDDSETRRRMAIKKLPGT